MRDRSSRDLELWLVFALFVVLLLWRSLVWTGGTANTGQRNHANDTRHSRQTDGE